MLQKVRTSKESNNSAIVQHSIKKFYEDINIDLVYSHVGYVRLSQTIILTNAGLAKVCPYANFSEYKSVHQLLSCAHIIRFANYPGTLLFFLHDV